MTNALIMNRYKTILLQVPVLLMILVAGCTKEQITDELPTEYNSVMLSLTTRAGENTLSSENERTIRALRLMIFNSEGVQVKNSYYEGASLNGLKKEIGTFSLTERLPRDLGQIKVCLIANEPSSWNLGRNSNKVSYVILSNLAIDYNHDFNFINNNGNSDDLNLYLSPDDCFLMYAETSINFVAGDVSIAETLPLIRTAAKVTLTLGYDNLLDVDYNNGEDFVLKNASISNQPVYSYLFANAYNNDQFFSTAPKILEYNPETKATRPITFYIPEYYLSAETFAADLITCIEVQGEYTTRGIKIPVVYKIPLGDRVQKIFADNNYTPVIGDYSISRNHHYVVDGRITKLGEKDGMQAKISIAPWIDGGSVEVESSAPYLNVSEIALQRTVSLVKTDISDKIFFWSNQPQSQIMLEPFTATYYDTDGKKIEISQDSSPQIDAEIIKYSEANGSNFFENNGYVTINVKLPSSITWAKLIVTFYIKAGSLKRQITITYHHYIENTSV